MVSIKKIIGPKQPLTARQLRNAFTISLVAGGCWIFFFETLFKALDPIFWLSILGPLVIMSLYIFYFVRSAHSPSLTEQFADSLYFLGFLMTILALVSTLIPYSSNLDVLSAEVVLSRFGIALLTTAYGLGGRVYFSHFDSNVEQLALDAQASLAERTQRLATELSLSIGTIRDFRVKAEKELNSVLETAGAHIKETTAASTKGIERTAETALDNMTRVLEGSLEALNTALPPALGKVEGSLAGFAGKIDAIEVPADYLTRLLAQAMADLKSEAANASKALGRVRSAADQVEKTWRIQSQTAASFEARLSSLGDMAATVTATREPLAQTVAAFERVANHAETVVRGSSAISDELSRSVRQAHALRGDLEAELHALRELRRGLETEVEAAGHATAALNAAIVEGSDYLRRELTGTQQGAVLGDGREPAVPGAE